MSTPSRSAAALIVRMPIAPPSDIDVARALGHEHAAGRRLVLGQLGPVVGHRLAAAVGQRAALGQQLGGRRGALVDRPDLACSHSVQAERRARRVVAAAGATAAPRSAGSRPPGPRCPASRIGRVVRDPVPEGRLLGRAAELRRLLEQDHLVAQPAGEQRRAAARRLRRRRPRRRPSDLEPLVLQVELALEPVHDLVGDRRPRCAGARSRARCASSTSRTSVW